MTEFGKLSSEMQNDVNNCIRFTDSQDGKKNKLAELMVRTTYGPNRCKQTSFDFCFNEVIIIIIITTELEQ